MDNIKSLEDKYRASSAFDLKNKLQETSIFMNNYKENEEQKLSEDEFGIQTLTSKLSSLLEELNQEKKLLETKTKDLNKYKEELKSLESEVKTLALEHQQLQSKRDNLKMIKPNSKDQRMIDIGLKKFNFLKEITGIRWNFEAPEDCTKGYVTNKHDYIHPFSYDTKNMSDKELNDALWDQIQKSTSISNIDKEASKENQINN